MATNPAEQVIRAGEWLTVLAAIIGPILAVQAQKWIEISRVKRARKDEIFRVLMATRAARLSPEHVQALNMINIAFYGTRFLGFRWQSAAEKTVCRSWRDYFDSLDIDNSKFTEDQNSRLFDTRLNKFIVLLSDIAAAQNYDFDAVELRRHMYSPNAHGKIEAEHDAIRSGLARIVSGERPLSMEVISFPKSA